ncbi:MAG: DNA-binding protein Alba [Candidatus Aenigmarchaeota archaeon]|nr:DNA-binding protein Alba [Candidatus Aenigmarchaeota archaeon]MCX8179139.1 DNA-binding protein Alba [Candidatus Aenigmarchaeota archaeon]
MAEKKKTESTTKSDENIIYVGKKPAMSYVLAVMTQFTAGAREVQIKARGKSISRAVDVAEIIKNKFLSDVKVKNIEIGTEERVMNGGNKVNVSTLSILLSKA